jgi:hypothetical protein
MITFEDSGDTYANVRAQKMKAIDKARPYLNLLQEGRADTLWDNLGPLIAGDKEKDFIGIHFTNWSFKTAFKTKIFAGDDSKYAHLIGNLLTQASGEWKQPFTDLSTEISRKLDGAHVRLEAQKLNRHPDISGSYNTK